MNSKYNPIDIENKWQKIWQDKNIFVADSNSEKQKYYVLEMFPYPSGKMHVGHLRNYTIGDVVARLKIMQGYNVLHPIGWDGFGLPAENAAIEHNVHPSDWTFKNIDNMRDQLKPIGFAYDWQREFATCHEDYYKHSQKIFLDFMAHGLAYQKESEVNWDPVDHTVIANEQVIDGRGWRSGALIEKKRLKQWFLKVTEFAGDLYNDIDFLDGWPEPVKSIQKKWIGKSTGAHIYFDIDNFDGRLIVFTTRPETIFGATFCAIAPDHLIAKTLAKSNKKIANFIKKYKQNETKHIEKEGVATGLFVNHVFLDKKIPIYIANFVLSDYGSGALFGCPAHDERDYEFANKYNLDIIKVIDEHRSVIINSDFLNGLSISAARAKIIAALKKNNLGVEYTNFRLHDWGISRQRYWGCPIPIIYCGSCGVVPVPVHQLPVLLPNNIEFAGKGNPLANHQDWKHVDCPKCGRKSERETDTFDTFFESSWYFLRFCNPFVDQVIDKTSVNYWMNVDQYIGGIEHAAMHLLYARFFMRAMTKCGYFNIKEPFVNLLTQGMVLHKTYKDTNGKWLYPEEAKGRQDIIIGRSEKMSKSKKNIVDPSMLLAEYGADATRFFMLSDTPLERDLDWSESGIDGAKKFLVRLWSLVYDYSRLQNITKIENDELNRLKTKTHYIIHSVTNNLEKLHFNVAIADIRDLSNSLFRIRNSYAFASDEVRKTIEVLLLLISPFTPHFAEELWSNLGHETLILEADWPKADLRLLKTNNATIAVQVNGKLRATTVVAKNMTNTDLKKHILALPNIAKYITNDSIKKIIIVPNRLVNVVV